MVPRTLPSSSGRDAPSPTRAAASLRPTRRNTTRWPASRARVSGAITAPPPSASTPVCSASAAATADRSATRKRSSPESTKMSEIERPSAASTSSSVSRSSTPSRRASNPPTVDLPAPMGPTSTTSGPVVGLVVGPVVGPVVGRVMTGSPDREVVEVGGQIALSLVDGVSAELLQHGVGQHQRHHRLRHHAGGGHGAHVGALVVGHGLLAGGGVDGAQG